MLTPGDLDRDRDRLCFPPPYSGILFLYMLIYKEVSLTYKSVNDTDESEDDAYEPGNVIPFYFLSLTLVYRLATLLCYLVVDLGSIMTFDARSMLLFEVHFFTFVEY